MTFSKKTQLITMSASIALLSASFPIYASQLDSDKDGIPDSAETILGTDPLIADSDGDLLNDKDDPNPLQLKNSIKVSNLPPAIIISSGKAEDNFNPITKKDVSDHIELGLQNSSDLDITGIEVFLNIEDTKDGVVEQYYRHLTHYKLAAHANSTLHFEIDGVTDWQTAQQHVRMNPNSIFYRSTAAKNITVQVVTEGGRSAIRKIHKDEGGAEAAD